MQEAPDGQGVLEVGRGTIWTVVVGVRFGGVSVGDLGAVGPAVLTCDRGACV
jgi:hypothetical protein